MILLNLTIYGTIYQLRLVYSEFSKEVDKVKDGKEVQI
jgi:hypothetical protein